MNTETEDRLVSPKKAAEVLGMSLSTIREWCRIDKIPSERLGRHRRIRWSTIEALMGARMTVVDKRSKDQ